MRRVSLAPPERLPGLSSLVALQNFPIIAWSVCRYLSTHRYNISLMHLVDQIASPYPKALMEQRTSINLDAWPTPQDYYYNIREGRSAAVNAVLHA